MAKAYRRSLLVFYLAAPPRKGDRGQDFRTVPGAPPPQFDAELDALIRDIKARQGIVRSLQEDLETEPVSFIGSVNMGLPAVELAARIARAIDFSVQVFQDQKTVETAFSYLRSRIEDSGVFVVLLGNLGSYHSNISADRFRGFAIADPIAPFVIVNDQDAKAAWSFTTVHEFVHLWLGTTGLSGANAAASIERYCNEVAGEMLLPSAEMAQLPNLTIARLTDAVQAISSFADSKNISRAMAAYRAFRAGLVSEDIWAQLNEHFRQEWLAIRAKQAEKGKQSEGGPSFYVVRGHRLGPALLHLVGNSLRDGSISYAKAGQVLGVKPRNVAPLLTVGGY